MTTSIAIAVVESSQIGEARRKAVTIASSLGFDESRQSNIGIVVTELANNLVRHAKQGVLLLRSISAGESVGLEALSIDKGPGMTDATVYLRDGVSTAGTAGNGLGAIDRLSDRFEIYSAIDQGTAILTQFWVDGLPAIALELGAICLPKTGETVSGDAWSSHSAANLHLILVADGLGHGEQAAAASQEAVRIFEANIDRSPVEIVELTHIALRSTRGAVVGIAAVNLADQTVNYVGVGNIAGGLYGNDQHKNFVSFNGTIGHEVRKIQAFPCDWIPNGLLILHSDGLGSHWRLDRYPGLQHQHPSLIAGVLYRDFNRGRDDVTIVVAREARE